MHFTTSAMGDFQRQITSPHGAVHSHNTQPATRTEVGAHKARAARQSGSQVALAHFLSYFLLVLVAQSHSDVIQSHRHVI